MSVDPRVHVTGHKPKRGWLSLGVTQAPEACDLQKEGKWEGACARALGDGRGRGGVQAWSIGCSYAASCVRCVTCVLFLAFGLANRLPGFLQ